MPSSALEIPQYALWMLAGWVLSCLISGWGGYRWGLRAQEEAEKLKARIDVLSIADSILADMWDNRDLWNPEGKRRSELRKATFRFSCQLGEAGKLRIDEALKKYQKLFIRYFEWPAKGTPERDLFDKDYKALVDGLKNLRDEISEA